MNLDTAPKICVFDLYLLKCNNKKTKIKEKQIGELMSLIELLQVTNL